MRPSAPAVNTAYRRRRQRSRAARYCSSSRSSHDSEKAFQSDSEPADSSASRIAGACTKAYPDSESDCSTLLLYVAPSTRYRTNRALAWMASSIITAMRVTYSELHSTLRRALETTGLASE